MNDKPGWSGICEDDWGSKEMTQYTAEQYAESLNYMVYALASAMGYPEDSPGVIVTTPEQVLDDALYMIMLGNIYIDMTEV